MIATDLLTQALAELAKVQVKPQTPASTAALAAAKQKVREARTALEPVKPPVEPTEAPTFAGRKITDFSENQSAPGDITEVSDPLGSGVTVFKMTVANADTLGGDGPRAQLDGPKDIEPGDDFWWSGKFMVPSGSPLLSLTGSQWCNVLEGAYGPPFNGSPPFELSVKPWGLLQWQRNETYAWDIPYSAPLLVGVWNEYLIHQIHGESGLIELWLNGAPITFFVNSPHNPQNIAPTTALRMKTRDASNDAGPNFAIIQQYRSPISTVGNPGGIATLFHGATLLGRTRASVSA